MTLTGEELILLKALSERERTISGNKNRNGLRRLIEAGYVDEISSNLSVTIYTITDLGRKVLAQVES